MSMIVTHYAGGGRKESNPKIRLKKRRDGLRIASPTTGVTAFAVDFLETDVVSITCLF